MFRNRKLRTKLFLGFALVLILSTVSTIAAIRYMRQIVENAEAMTYYPTFRTLEPHGKIVSAQQGFVRISRTVLYPNIGGRISAGLSQTPRRS